MLEFDTETRKILDVAYAGADVVRRRMENFRALDAKPGETILDLGCGTGPLTLEIARTVGGDGRVIDGFLNGLAMGVIPFFTRLAGRAQSGYIFTYAFAMVIGIAVLVTWMTFIGGAE